MDSRIMLIYLFKLDKYTYRLQSIESSHLRLGTNTCELTTRRDPLKRNSDFDGFSNSAPQKCIKYFFFHNFVVSEVYFLKFNQFQLKYYFINFRFKTILMLSYFRINHRISQLY